MSLTKKTNPTNCVVLDQVIAGRKMESCKVAIVLTIYIMATLAFSHCCVTESFVEEVAAIPPTPMESAGVHFRNPGVYVAIAFVVDCFI
ncbi:hypothetical protein Fmac_004951 [Flemingia macrophylla]|uniref:Uncharacterized protein n=1 Tax=Flemingia macrophylla TaxID=520843 RepID=A0ABD1N6Y8_9FABA